MCVQNTVQCRLQQTSQVPECVPDLGINMTQELQKLVNWDWLQVCQQCAAHAGDVQQMYQRWHQEQFALTMSFTLLCTVLQPQALQVFLTTLMHVVLTSLLLAHWLFYCKHIVLARCHN